MTTTRPPLMAIGDLHGHLDLFERLLERIGREVPEARIVTLGDLGSRGRSAGSTVSGAALEEQICTI